MQILRCFLYTSAILFPFSLFGQGEPGIAPAELQNAKGVHANNKDLLGFRDLVEQDSPSLLWSFEDSAFAPQTLSPHRVKGDFKLIRVGMPALQAGARPPLFKNMPLDHQALKLDGQSYLRIQDPGVESVFDFEKGDAITIEAWVAPERLQGSYTYIIGKGRTYLTGQSKENHNWSLRLSQKGGGAGLSFMFRSAGQNNDYHRWESLETIAVGDGWHHIGVAYTFGKKNSIRGYIDGRAVAGKWELGGDTDRAPQVNNDEVWIGSSMAGNRASSFAGGLDEIAIHRKILSPERFAERYEYASSPMPSVEVLSNKVLVQLFDKVPDQASWNFRSLNFAESFTQETFAFTELPKRYDQRGVRIDRPTPLLLHAHADVVLPKGKHRLLFRSRERSRLFLDDKLLAETDSYAISDIANGPVFELDRNHAPNIRPLQRGDRQQVVEIEGDGKTHRLRYEALLGLKKRKAYLGEASVSVAKPSEDFQIISFSTPFALTNVGWREFREMDRRRLVGVNKRRRDEAGIQATKYWAKRHVRAREFASAAGHDEKRNVDSFFSPVPNAKSLDDLAFLRRLCLDVVGTVPDRELIGQFLRLPESERRSRIIDQLLADNEGWADHWTGYWQDVLAENPNIVNPTLNNTGPFRWWIHESFQENKPFDRFVTELVMMEGGETEGGPAGFALASANDVPMAAKGHLIGQAFLGIQMQCARCHDAPAHEIVQEDLFSLAAMLKREPEQVPKTSSIDLPPEELAQIGVAVTLKPGSEVTPAWPFPNLASPDIPAGVLQSPGDTREQLAALITLPQNVRFAKVAVNRLWKRYLGRGLVDSVDDWEVAEVYHPELLNWLSFEFIRSGYNLKHLAGLIFASQAYQRIASTKPSANGDSFQPAQKHLAAEQLLDSMFVISGKPFNAGQMTFDIDGARPAHLSLHLGRPRRAWMFTATSNERDRPGLAMPFAEPFVTFLEQFGWRGSRQNPINQRPDDLTALQPAEFANGVLAQRLIRLSDDHRITKFVLRKDLKLEELTDELYLRFFTRYPTESEKQVIMEFLTAGFDSRRQLDHPRNAEQADRRGMVSWSNHLEEEASTIKIELQEQVRLGDPATLRIDSDWRERLEDVIWSLINSPEFRFSP
ncbi:MAG: DUF1553 domain-containing protein [Planctomycetota bacterium]